MARTARAATLEGPTTSDPTHILAALQADFRDHPKPPFDTSPGVEELVAAAALTVGQTWRTAGPEVLDAVHEALPWLSPPVFVYWLPGLLADLLRDPSRSGWYGECLLLALTLRDAADLPRLLASLERGRRAGETGHDHAAAAVTRYEREERADRVESRWREMNAAQRRDVLSGLDYLALSHGSRSAARAAERWRAFEGGGAET